MYNLPILRARLIHYLVVESVIGSANEKGFTQCLTLLIAKR